MTKHAVTPHLDKNILLCINVKLSANMLRITVACGHDMQWMTLSDGFWKKQKINYSDKLGLLGETGVPRWLTFAVKNEIVKLNLFR